MVFDPPEIGEVEGYHLIEIAGCGRITTPGHPALPMKALTLKLHRGDVIADVAVEVSTEELNGTYHVSPAPRPSYDGADYELTDPDPSIYESGEPYPGRWYDYEVKEGLDPQTMRRVRYLILRLYPVQYTPKTGRLTIGSRMRISVRYRSGVGSSSRGALVQSYDLLIITSPLLESYAAKLMYYKNSVGVSTLVKTTEEIYADFEGRDHPEKIRNCIKSAVESYGITAVLILGDEDQVPARYVYIPDGESIDGDLVETDLYYADLQYTWDDNDDGLWGDLDNDEVDGLPDLLIGRLPVSTEYYASVVVDKVIEYERYNSPEDPWFNTALLIGTDPFEGEEAEGEILMDYIADNYIWENFTVRKLY
ncbi:MAG: Peptidase family C25, partial [Candidatus Bathyarchaeota archaeon B23]